MLFYTEKQGYTLHGKLLQIELQILPYTSISPLRKHDTCSTCIIMYLRKNKPFFQ